MSRNDVFYYYSGSGGMIVKHMIMLSPEYIHWNDDLETHCSSIDDINKQADIKLQYSMKNVFGIRKSDSFTKWRQLELYDIDSNQVYNNIRSKHFLYSGWAGSYNEWSKNTEQTEWFENNTPDYKIFLDCHDIFYPFILRAAYEKNVGFFAKLTRQRTGLHETEQWKLNGEYDRKIDHNDIKAFIDMYMKWYDEWTTYKHSSDVHIITMKKLMFSTYEDFIDEYNLLCTNLEITPMIRQAKLLKDHWCNIQWKRKSLIK